MICDTTISIPGFDMNSFSLPLSYVMNTNFYIPILIPPHEQNSWVVLQEQGELNQDLNQIAYEFFESYCFWNDHSHEVKIQNCNQSKQVIKEKMQKRIKNEYLPSGDII